MRLPCSTSGPTATARPGPACVSEDLGAAVGVSALALLLLAMRGRRLRLSPCPLLAQMRSADWFRKCLLLGVDRTYRGHHEADAIDPERTLDRYLGIVAT